MKTIEYTLRDELGLHARPAGQLVQIISKFESTVEIKTTERTENAKGIIGVMTLGLKQGQNMIMTFDGPDEDIAAAAAFKFLSETL
jgi:Phosphotransferase System HPr (HPr) Family